MTERNPIRIMLADDHEVIRQGLSALIENASVPMLVVGEAADGQQAIEMVAELSPDVIIMDVGMPNVSGIEATQRIEQLHPGTKIIALSVHADQRFVAEMLRAGASAYLLKTCGFAELTEAIKCVLSGRKYLSPDVTDGVIADFLADVPVAKEPPPEASLTDREREVLQLLVEGMPAKAIAQSLHVSAKTIHSHRQHIMEKLGLDSMAELTKYAIRHGITSVE